MLQSSSLEPGEMGDVLQDIAVDTESINIAESVADNWQKILDLLSEVVNVPSALIMKVSPARISVFSSSRSSGNPYRVGDTESLGHGLYCETVIANQSELCIPNALKDKDWDQNPDIRLGMIAYCGLPLTWPDQTPFGTICILDREERHFDEVQRKLLERFQYSVNNNLRYLYYNEQLRLLNAQLESRVAERTQELTQLNKKLINEIERRSKAERYVELYQSVDELTGLAKRPAFLRSVDQMLEHSAGKTVSVLYLALRSFKSVNDSYGYMAGDRLLKLVSQRLKDQLGNPASLARISGVEFAVALSHDDGRDSVLSCIEKVMSAFNTPFQLGELMINIRCSIGVSQSISDGSCAVDLIQRASAAMGLSKAEMSPYTFFSSYTQSSVERRYLLESHLAEALNNDELSLHFQPFVCPQTQTVMGAEALLRWNNPVLGWVPPDQFIELAEYNGLILDIGNFVLHSAMTQTVEWRRSNPDFIMAINVSPIQFIDPAFPEHIRNLLHHYGLPASSLELEITEGVLLNNREYAKKIIDALRAMGVMVSLDDFGTGYSSLSYLQTFQFNTLKIDRCFIANLEHNEKDRELTRAIIAMAKKLNLKVVAEGVETGLHNEFIRNEGCDIGQGYHYSKPVAADEFRAKFFDGQFSQ